MGVPVLPADAPEVLLVEWLSYPDGQVNQGFLDSLREAGVEPGTPLYFLCRSGVRSRAAAAAATSAGLGPAHNVLDGFEGGHDDDGHRSVSGWKNVGLPWRQG